MALLIGSWLIMCQQLFRLSDGRCFRLLTIRYTSCWRAYQTERSMRFKSDELNGEFDGSVKSGTFVCRMQGVFYTPSRGVVTPQLSYNTPGFVCWYPLIAHSSYFGRLHTRGLPGLSPNPEVDTPQLSSPRKLPGRLANMHIDLREGTPSCWHVKTTHLNNFASRSRL